MILYSRWGRDINLCDITINPLSYNYSGKACEPSAIIVDNLATLALDTDFTLEYDNNINAGEATVTIRGINTYAGVAKKTFTIKPANISVATVSPQRQVLSFNGEAQAPTYVLRNGDVTLVEDVDYTISGNDGNSAVGDYTVTFTGKGNYNGTTTATYTIQLTDPTKIFKTTVKHYNIFQSIPRGIQMGWEKLSTYVQSLKLVATPEGAKSLGGFGAIGSIFPEKWNWLDFWNITAFLAVILAVMNILPIPILDGGYVLFLLIEMITGWKPSEKVMNIALNIGLALLVLLLLYANINDVYRFLIK